VYRDSIISTSYTEVKFFFCSFCAAILDLYRNFFLCLAANHAVSAGCRQVTAARKFIIIERQSRVLPPPNRSRLMERLSANIIAVVNQSKNCNTLNEN
jgi:uncharacterized protein (UPF0305 family)